MLLVIDNNDSFTRTPGELFGEVGTDPHVVRNDAVLLTDIARMAPSATVPLIQHFGATMPLLDVCLGHQAMGKTSRVQHDGTGLFAGNSASVEVMRNHSLIIEFGSLPDSLENFLTLSEVAS